MRQTLNDKVYGPVQRAAADVQLASRQIGNAAQAQTALMVALTVVAVTALMVAVIVARRTS
ncbi:hypothetical protein ABZ208_37580 [Streptomyces sp. NPDC006208]|uniref:hypothetical protein n=1 Tax=Streptomyces sp. NPDC006208 TaxID=3156734 RepID=UPI0033AF667F